MAKTNLPFRKWVIAIHFFQTKPKGISSIQMVKDLGISQKSTWHLIHRLREAMDQDIPIFEGEVELDETYSGGLRKNRSLKNRRATQSTAGREGWLVNSRSLV